jgi:hypothetical protein
VRFVDLLAILREEMRSRGILVRASYLSSLVEKVVLFLVKNHPEGEKFGTILRKPSLELK